MIADRSPGRWLRGLAAVAGLSATFFLGGCYAGMNAPVIPPQGMLYSNVSAPLTTNFSETPTGAAITKTAKRNTRYFYVPFTYGLLSFGWDEAAVQKIAKEGGITDIAYAEYSALNILGIYAEFTITVYGN